MRISGWNPVWIALLALLLALGACGNDDDDGSNDDDDITGPNDDDGDDDDLPAECEIDACPDLQALVDEESPECYCDWVYNEWLKVEPEGKVCGNGSQYKFFVNFSPDSDNLVFIFEPGGACWDFESCTGQSGIRGAANPNGINDDHMDTRGIMHPFTWRDYVLLAPEQELPTHSWNYIFVPYCTGDVHTGNNVITYANPNDPNESVEFHHAGHENVMAILDWANDRFPVIPKMMATGCSAGGAGTLANYFFIRDRLPQIETGYMLNDSGPIYPNSEYSQPLHDKIRSSWDVDPIIEAIIDDYPGWSMEDFGNLNAFLAEQFPNDRLSITYFLRDLNYSLYSYERFFNLDFHILEEKGTILEYWWDDTKKLMDMYDQYDNLAYYLPYYRGLNSSHCASIATYGGTEMEVDGMEISLFDFIEHLLDDETPLQSFIEDPQPGEDEPELDYQ